VMNQVVASVLIFLCVLGLCGLLLLINKNTSHLNWSRRITWYVMWLGVGFMLGWFIVILNYTLKVLNG
jgi:hypothetical protein